MVNGFDLLFLEVNNLEESLFFYHDQLGFEIDSSSPDSEPPMATLRVGNFRITLAQHLETMLRRGRGAHFFLGVTDVDAYYEQLKARGDVKGEITLLIAKAEGSELRAASSEVSVGQRVKQVMSDDQVDEKAALKKVAKERGIGKSEAYREWQRSK